MAAARARSRYSCFDHVSSADDGQAYGFRAASGAGLSCERETIDQLVEIQRNALAYAHRDGMLAEDELFYAEQNAQVVRDAERYTGQRRAGDLVEPAGPAHGPDAGRATGPFGPPASGHAGKRRVARLSCR